MGSYRKLCHPDSRHPKTWCTWLFCLGKYKSSHNGTFPSEASHMRKTNG